MDTLYDTLYDTVIIGGGPAGLAAALHLAWHQRKVLVIDRVTGPLFFTLEKLWNVPGMPEATGVEIQKKLKAQATSMGAELKHANVVTAAGKEENFLLTGSKGETWRGRTLLLATGVARYHPTVDGDFSPCFAYAGKGNLFYCSDCEGPELFGKDTIVIGTGQPDWAASMAVGLSRYTQRLRLLLTGDAGDAGLSPQWAERLQGRNIPVLTGEIKRLIGDRHPRRAQVATRRYQRARRLGGGRPAPHLPAGGRGHGHRQPRRFDDRPAPAKKGRGIPALRLR
jgi:thioredoxin reductase